MSRLASQTNMEWVRSGDDIFVRLDIGEEIHASLQALAEEANIDAAAITSGIGRTRGHVYGFMDESKNIVVSTSLRPVNWLAFRATSPATRMALHSPISTPPSPPMTAMSTAAIYSPPPSMSSPKSTCG